MRTGRGKKEEFGDVSSLLGRWSSLPKGAKRASCSIDGQDHHCSSRALTENDMV